MKKLGKKQKLIGGIAIILIAVILAIVITTNIIVNNNQSNQLASQEEYLATTANAGSSLVASYIKKGITIGGVTGTLETLDTSDATAKPEDIALGKTAYVKGEKITGTYVEPISNEDLQISVNNVYYADLDSTGEITVDGVIFADLAGAEESGTWGTLENNASWGVYTIPEETNLKKYYIKGEYTDEHFGTGKVIAPVEGTSGNDRFYVMALDNIDNSTHYWWENAYGKLDSTYNVAETTNDFAVAGAEPIGLANTRRMMECYKNEEINGETVAKGTNDMWGLIEEQFNSGWFVPSKSEWSVFGKVFAITSSNYDDKFGLDVIYWSSSQKSKEHSYRIDFNRNLIHYDYLYGNLYVRLATTF